MIAICAPAGVRADRFVFAWQGRDNVKFSCRCTYLEIYNESITDLLNPAASNLQIRENTSKIYVEGLSEHAVLNGVVLWGWHAACLNCVYPKTLRSKLGDPPHSAGLSRGCLDRSSSSSTLTFSACCHCLPAVDDVMTLMRKGADNRHVGETRLNRESSRSHSVFTCFVDKTLKTDDGRSLNGRLHLVDLAGEHSQASFGGTEFLQSRPKQHFEHLVFLRR